MTLPSGPLRLAVTPDGPRMAVSKSDIGTSIGPYRVTDKLGEGGMGAVYRARRHEHSTATVAVKMLLEAFAVDPDRLARSSAKPSSSRR